MRGEQGRGRGRRDGEEGEEGEGKTAEQGLIPTRMGLGAGGPLSVDLSIAHITANTHVGSNLLKLVSSQSTPKYASRLAIGLIIYHFKNKQKEVQITEDAADRRQKYSPSLSYFDRNNVHLAPLQKRNTPNRPRIKAPHYRSNKIAPHQKIHHM